MRVALAIALSVALVAPSTAWAGKFRKVEHAAADQDPHELTHALHSHRSYVRELAAKGLAPLPPTRPAAERLLKCVADSDERDWVRSACASTLGTWRIAEGVPAITNALGEVGAEARYWMAEALSHIGGTEARAAIAGLASDPDLFVSTAAREWSR